MVRSSDEVKNGSNLIDCDAQLVIYNVSGWHSSFFLCDQ